MDMIVKNTKKTGARVSTFDLWEKFGYTEHRTLKRVIAENLHSFEEDGFLHLQVQKPKGAKGGRPDESYLLNEQQFVTLVMLAKNTPEAKEFKLRIKREFFRMREQLQELGQYAKVRSDGKEYRKKETDVIKQFIEMAKAQGASDGISHLYSTLTSMENKALFVLEHNYPNIRDVLNTGQLMQVCVADQIVERVYAEAVETNMHYKDAYKLAKERVNAYAAVVGKSPILMLAG
jgi:phage regulator Rha-like protein